MTRSRPSTYFYPRPPRGGRPGKKVVISNDAVFLSTPSARRATQWYINFANKRLISIHALREEGDQTVQKVRFYRSVFLSTPSARRATQREAGTPHSDRFLSTPSARRATLSLGVAVDDQIISIHALREEGDGILPLLVYCHIPFLSTPSVRRTTV